MLQLSPPRTQGSPQVLAMPPLVVSEWDHLGGAAAAGGACGEEGPHNSLFQPVGQSNSQESEVKCFRGSSGDSRFQVSPLVLLRNVCNYLRVAFEKQRSRTLFES